MQKIKSEKSRKSRDVIKNKDFFLDAAKFYRFLLYTLPFVLLFSYFPVIKLAESGVMNFELSVPLIWLAVFDVDVLYLLVRKKMYGGLTKTWKWWLLPGFLSLSVLWSGNFLRGLLTVGILWLLYFAGYGILSFRNLFSEISFKERFWRCFFSSGIFISLWCLVQCILDLGGVGREYSLMCAGCTYKMFGFPHPNGFAIEPQFMGNLLLAPTLILFYMIIQNSIFRRRRPSCPSSTLIITLIIIYLMLSMTLFLTFSRGAIYAFGVASVVMMVMMGVKNKSWKVATGVLWIGLAFLLALNIQGVMAEMSETNDTYMTGVSKVLNHLSLGIIKIDDVRKDNVEFEKHNVELKKDDVKFEKDNIKNKEEKVEAAFDGYVAESTDTRLKLTDVAIKTWSKDLRTMIFGVGLGGAGQALYDEGLSPSPKEIVQNQYASLLLETGLIGIVLFALTVFWILKAIMKSSEKIVLFALIMAYAVTLCFFSGLPNALHIYIVPVLVYSISLRKKLVS